MARTSLRPTLIVGLPYLGVLAAVAFSPTPVDRGAGPLLDRALAWLGRRGLGVIDYQLVEAAANVALFVPLGVLVALQLRARWSWLAVPIGALVSAGVETTQLLLLSQRFATVQDVLMNTLGSALGAGIGALLRWRLVARERRRAAERDLALAHIPLRGSSGVLGDHPVRRH